MFHQVPATVMFYQVPATVREQERSSKTAGPNHFGTSDRFRARQFFHGPGGRGRFRRNASDGERWGAADEASLAHPLLTSCCAARGLGTPAPRHTRVRDLKSQTNSSIRVGQW